MLIEYLPEIKTSDSMSIHTEIKDFNSSYSVDNINIKTNSDYEIKYTFYNYTAKVISVKTRDGMCIEIKPIPQVDNSYFIIRKQLSITKYSLESAIKYITALCSKDKNTDLEKVRNMLIESMSKPYLQEIVISLDYKFSPGSLINSYNGIYHSLTDTVLSDKTVLEVPEHPYSPLFINIGDFGKVNRYNDFNKNEAHFKVRFMSRENKKIYFYCLGELHQLQSEVPFAKKDIFVTNLKTSLLEVIDTQEYVEVFSSYSSKTSDKRDGVCIRRFSLEEAEKVLGMYTDMFKANQRGDHESYIKNISEDLKRQYSLEKTKLDKEILETKKRLNDTEVELQKNKQKLELEKLDFEKEKMQQENEKKQLEIEEEKIKNKNRELAAEMEKFKQLLEIENFKNKLNHDNNKIITENKILNKKNFIEFLKIAPAILGSAIGLFTIIKSLKK